MDGQWYHPQSVHELWEYDPHQGLDADDWLGRINKVNRSIMEANGFVVQYAN